tara:strand:- start:287 stop:454 length:168 start_codon:yes stop_codon:yes gene_type:complete
LFRIISIPIKLFSPTNGIIENIDKLGGIVCKSNFSNIYTDINPSFNFKMFVENEI